MNQPLFWDANNIITAIKSGDLTAEECVFKLFEKAQHDPIHAFISLNKNQIVNTITKIF